MNLNWWLILATGLVPLFVGSLWYSPLLFANAWIKETGLKEEELKNANMIKIFGFTALFGIMLAVALTPIVIHQMGAFSTLATPDMMKEGSEIKTYFMDFMSKYATNFRTFKHGALHGTITGIFLVLPIMGVNALFERKSWKYIFIHVGFWTVSAALMGGIICAFA